MLYRLQNVQEYPSLPQDKLATGNDYNTKAGYIIFLIFKNFPKLPFSTDRMNRSDGGWGF